MTQITIQLLNLNDNLTSRARLYDRWRDKNHRAKRVYVQIAPSFLTETVRTISRRFHESDCAFMFYCLLLGTCVPG